MTISLTGTYIPTIALTGTVDGFAATPRLDFSIAANSMYLGMV